MFRQNDLAQYVHQSVEFVSKLIFRLNSVSYYIHQSREFMAPYTNQGLEFACLHFLNFALKDVSWKQFDCLAVHGCGNWTNHSVLALKASSTDDNESKLITVVNLTTRLWQECPVGTLAKTERDHCPENAISAHGQQWIHVSMLIFICVFVLGAGLTYKKEKCGRFLFWTALFLCRAPVCLPKPSQIGGSEQFYATLRDFKSSHPDFENPANNGIWSATKGLVDKKLGEDRKPVFIGGRTLSSQGNFNEWYNNVRGKNKEEHVTLHMTRTAAGTLVMDSPSFFPLDGKGFRDEVFGHNYFFTMEMHHTFVYKGGERFTFIGDDDCWVFINGQLALDLGGTHTPLEETIDLDKLGLTRGRRASLDLFYAERHTKTSSLRIETTAQLEQENCCVVGLTRIAKYLMKQYDNLSAYIMRGQKSGDM